MFKRGMKGVYQHCSEKHLHRYLAEFDFRYSNRSKLGIEDMERMDKAPRASGLSTEQLAAVLMPDKRLGDGESCPLAAASTTRIVSSGPETGQAIGSPGGHQMPS